MSQANVDLASAGVVAMNETFESRDMGPWTRYVEAVFDPEIVLEMGSGAFTEGEWRGHPGLVQYLASAMDVLEDMWIRADDIIDVSDELLIVLVTFGGHARHTGIKVENSLAHVFGMHAGTVTRWQVFEGRKPALEAIGLGD
jgi:ketosteroid isomerase-like protein